MGTSRKTVDKCEKIGINKMRIKEMIDARQSANREILDILKQYVEKYPELRFGQILAIAKVIEYERVTEIWSPMVESRVKDPFNEESIHTIDRVKEQTNYTLKNNFEL